jgi:hypothetical protein
MTKSLMDVLRERDLLSEDLKVARLCKDILSNELDDSDIETRTYRELFKFLDDKISETSNRLSQINKVLVDTKIDL